MFPDVEQKLKKKNALLLSRDSECLQGLKAAKASHARYMGMDYVKVPLMQFEEKYPYELRPRSALTLCEAWARGNIKMPAAKRVILDSTLLRRNLMTAYTAHCAMRLAMPALPCMLKSMLWGCPFMS